MFSAGLQGEMPDHLVAELETQQKLYEEVMYKTQQLRRLQDVRIAYFPKL